MTGGSRARAPAVAVAIISYNTRAVLRDCLESVAAEPAAEVVVVDNGSTDGSIDLVRREFPTAWLVVDPSNPGYGAASNRAVAACTAPYVLLLNSDTVLPAGTLAALAAYMDAHPRAGMAGPRLVNADGSLQRSCFAFPSTPFLLVEQTPLRALARWVPGARRHFFIDWPHDEARAVPWVLGAALMLRRDAFEAVGGYDPSYHMYYEEVDLAFRLAAAGWETHFAPVAEVTHLGGASTAKLWAAMKVRYFRSLVQFGATHRSPAEAARLASTLRALVLAKLGLESAHRRLVRDPARRRILDEQVAMWRELARVPFAREAREHRERSTGARRANEMARDGAARGR